MIAVFTGLVALVVGVALGWALRGPAKWCGRCGDTLRCPQCSPLPAVGRAAIPMRQPAVPTADRPLPHRLRNSARRI